MDFLRWWDKVPQTHLYDDCGNDISWIFDAIRSGYYVPSVEQTEPGNMTITFTPAGEWMGDTIVTTIQLPRGEKGDKGDKGDKGEKGDRGLQGITPAYIPIARTVRGTGDEIKTQLISLFNAMPDNAIVGVYVDNTDNTLDNLAFTGYMSKVESVGNIRLTGVDSDCEVFAKFYNISGIEDLTPWRWLASKNTMGKEYLTADNYNGTPVYQKVLALGKVPEKGTKLVKVVDDISDKIMIISVTAHGTKGTTPIRRNIAPIITVEAVGSLIGVTTSADASTSDKETVLNAVVRYTRV